MKKIGVIGHFGGPKKFNDGQTVKTIEVNNYIEEYFNITTDKLDTYYHPKNLFSIFFRTYKIMKSNDIIILIVSNRGYKVIAPLMFYLNKKFKKKIYELVIGGTRYNEYNKSKFMRKVAKSFTKIYVETTNMKKEYNKRNIYNVDVLPNFKHLKIAKIASFREKKELKICTFSRVNILKGIEDAIEAVKLANNILKKNVFYLDIYGQIDKDYKERFEHTIVPNLPAYIKYSGEVPFFESVNTIKKYDLMLFLTFWEREGFPGTLLDSIFSGVPTISTEWNCNFEILTDKKNALKVQVHDIEKVAELLVELYKNQEKLYEMKKECLASAKLYTPDYAMKDFIEELKR